MKEHPIAKLFPLMSDERLEKLAADIGARGLLHPIVTLDDRILDGRNRFRACQKAGVTPKFEAYRGKDPLAYVISANVERRHLSESQRSMVAGRMADLPKGSNQHASIEAPSQEEAAVRLNVSRSNVQRARLVLSGGAPELVEAVDGDLIAVSAAAKVVELLPDYGHQAKLVSQVERGEVKGTHVLTAIRKIDVKAKLDDEKTKSVKAAEGLYDVIVLDPPWAMEKIEREERPNQTGFDYTTMGEDELKALTLPCAEDCHVWVWTTHRFMPMAMRLLDAWNLKYVCSFVWHKVGGFQPVGLPQYNCEFALYARRGSPSFVDTKAFPVCFEAPRGAHTEKPEAFYETIRRVTAGRRLDMFNRRAIEGFDTWGKEAA